MSSLSQTGTAALLQELSPFLDDEMINSLLPEPRGPGRPRDFCSAQLFRVLLLSLLTPAHSFNLLLALLPENGAWRRFAQLQNRRDKARNCVGWVYIRTSNCTGLESIRKLSACVLTAGNAADVRKNFLSALMSTRLFWAPFG